MTWCSTPRRRRSLPCVPAIPFWWYDRKGNKPPMEVFEKHGITDVASSGVLIVGEKGAFYSSDDYCGKYELKGVEFATG